MWSFNILHLWVLLAGVITLVYWYIRHQFSYWSKKGVPFKKPHWLYGNFEDVIKAKISPAEFSAKIYKEFRTERMVGVWQIFSPILFAIDPALIRDILVKDFATWSSRGIVINPEVDPLALHLINLDGKMWKSVRTKLTPTFTSGKLKEMYHLLLECGKNFEKHLDAIEADGGLIEARETSARFTTDVIGSCGFGLQMNSLSDENSQFRNMGKKIVDGTKKRMLVRLFKTSFTSLFRLLKLRIQEREVTDFFLRITKQNLDYRDRIQFYHL